MKNVYFLCLAGALALAGCSTDDYIGDQNLQAQNDGAIMFQSKGMASTRATAGKGAADLLGGNFIVEGIKGTESTISWTPTTVVFDNYLVAWGANTAGTTADNTNDWKYVGVTGTTNVPTATLTGLGRSVDQQTIKYWDYSAPKYAFMAISTGTLATVAGTADPVSGTSVHVTKIASTLPGDAASYTFKAKSAADFAKCYYTDVTPVVPTNYGKPVTLTFKNLAAKVRVGLYETIPGYSVKDVKFYADMDNIKYTAVASPSHADVFTTAVWNASDEEIAVGTAWADGTYYNATGHDEANKIGDNSAIHGDATTEVYYESNGTEIPKYTAYNSSKTYYEPTAPNAENDATLFLGSGNFPEDGTITVSYPLVGTDNSAKNGYNKADVAVTGGTVTTTKTKTFGALTNNYVKREHKEVGDDATKIFLGRTLAEATMAGASANGYYTAVIPVSTGAALTLRCNYTLVSTDGSGETIKVWGAKAVVPANFCEWQPNYAYTYIFKISDNTNGSTEKLGGDKEGLFPITFDAVVADYTEVNGEMTTVTTVATPYVTSYQYGHKMGEEYKAGDIYVQVLDDSKNLMSLTSTNTKLYTTTDNTATEADVIDALQMSTSTSPNIVGRNGLTLVPETTPIDLGAHNIPTAYGTTINVADGKSGKFTAVASKNYVFVHDYTTSATPSDIYSYDNAASTAAPSDWKADATNPYYTKTGVDTYVQVTTAWAAGVYYKKYTNNGRSYAVKVIKTGTAY